MHTQLPALVRTECKDLAALCEDRGVVGTAADSTGCVHGGVEERVESLRHGHDLVLDANAELSLVVSAPGEYLLCVRSIIFSCAAHPDHDAELIPASNLLNLVDFVLILAIRVEELYPIDLLLATTLSPRRAPKGVHSLLGRHEGHKVESTG